MARGAVVVVFSDGWERGDAALLGEQMARLRRIAHRVVWVNPHRGKDGYEAVQQGVRRRASLSGRLRRRALARDVRRAGRGDRGCVRYCRSCWSGGGPARRSASAPSWRPSARPRARRAPRCWSAPTRPPSARCRAAASRAPSTTSARRSSTAGSPVLQRYGISDDDAFAVGLTCGGILDVYVEKVSRETFPELEDLAADLEAGRPVAVATVIEHPDPAWLGPARRGPPRRAGHRLARLDPGRRRGPRRRDGPAGQRHQRHPDLRARRRAPRRGDAGLRVGVRPQAADAGLRRDRLRGRGRPGRQLPRLPRDRLRRPAGVRDQHPLPRGRRGRRRVAPPVPGEAARRRRDRRPHRDHGAHPRPEVRRTRCSRWRCACPRWPTSGRWARGVPTRTARRGCARPG